MLKKGVVFLFGLLTPWWETWAISQLAFAVSVLSDSSAAGPAMLWMAIYLPSLVLGLVAGVIVVVTIAEAPLKGWLVFLGALVLGVLGMAAYAGAPVRVIAETLKAAGNWFFVLGSVVVPVLMVAMKRGDQSPAAPNSQPQRREGAKVTQRKAK